MARWLVVLVPLVLSTTPARAEAPCACSVTPVLLPAYDARDVPRNTKIWIVGGPDGEAGLEVLGGDEGPDRVWIGAGVREQDTQLARYDIPRLVGGLAYRFGTAGPMPRMTTRFTTARDDDRRPPAAPVVRRLAIAARDDDGAMEPVAEVRFDAALDPDVVLLRFQFENGGLSFSQITTVDGWRELGRPACGTGLILRPGDEVSVSVSAIDLAGNESPPATQTLEVARGAASASACARPRYMHCGLGSTALVVLGGMVVVLGGIVLLAVLLVSHFSRVRAARLAVPELISLIVAERLARGVQRRAGVLAAIGVVGVPALVVMDLGPLAIISTVVGCIGLRGYCLARAVLRLVDGGEGVMAEARGPLIAVRGPGGEAELEVKSRAIARARRHAVPTSIVNR